MLKMTIPLFLGLAIAGGASAARAGDPTGTWIMSNGKLTVRVSKCGGGLCGSLVALKEPLDKQGRPKVDKRNPNPALRKRPLLGVSLFSGVRPQGDDKWAGSIYNPDDGKTYSATMTLSGNAFKVKGCVLGILCKSQRFARID